ncbi:hypothetical protein [Streptomyces sirii]|uniref:hypothetical protein n=1 Tax=Streptomyces sirii TaxID=3127701 RepID=UPI003D36EA57
MLRQIRSQLAARRREKADAAIRKLRDDAEYLGIGPIPGPVRVALRTYHETKWKMRLIAPPVAIWVMSFVSIIMKNLVKEYAPSWVTHAIYDKPGEKSMATIAGWISFSYTIIIVWLSFLLARRLIVSLARFLDIHSLTFERVQRWAELISECADTVRAPHMRPDLQGVSLRLAELRVKGARSMRGTVPPFSRRRPELRKHANRVIATMRATHAEFDVDRKVAARKLAGLALQISDRYAQGHVGALLDSQNLVQPTRRREALHLAVLAGVMAASGFAVQVFHIPAPLAIGAVVLTGAWLYRSAASAGLAVLAALLPVLFPGK